MAMETGNTFVAMDRKCEGGDGVAGNINGVAGAGASAGLTAKTKHPLAEKKKPALSTDPPHPNLTKMLSSYSPPLKIYL
jgi:hypothetical protein